MSLYRFARLTAILTLLRRYRSQLFRMLFAVVFALITAWQYQDVARFLDQHYPQWAATALLIKTLIVYAALLLVFWELARMLRGDVQTSAPSPGRSSDTSRPAGDGPSRLDALVDKPQLRSRRDDILSHKARQEKSSRRTPRARSKT